MLELADFGHRTFVVFVTQERERFIEDRFDFFADGPRDDVVHNGARRVVDTLRLAEFVGVFDGDAALFGSELVGEETFIDRAHDVAGHQREIITVKVLVGRE